MKNILLQHNELPQFSKIKLSSITPTIEKILAQNRKEIKALLYNKPKNYIFAWDNLIAPMEELSDRLHFAFGIASHLNHVKNSPELRKIYAKILPKVTKYGLEIEQNVDLFRAIESIYSSTDFKKLHYAQQKVITNALRDFRLAGVLLKPKQKAELTKLQQKLSKLHDQFSNNVLDATYSWEYLANEKEIAGIPEHNLAQPKQKADKKKVKGWLFNLDQVSYQTVMTYADSEELRKTFYTAYITKASDQSKNKKFDNSKIIAEILKLRLYIAHLLGFKNYAELSLATKMAKSPIEVLSFLSNIAKKSRNTAQKELIELTKFSQKKKLNPWDIPYYSEKLKQKKYAVDENEIRQYFPVDQVLNGLFTLVKKIFAINIKEIQNFDAWHKDVRLFEIYDMRRKTNNICGRFYMDLYARENKQGGAWMDDCQSRHILQNKKVQIPTAYLICNFLPPTKKTPSLLTHDEVHTLFHEFGHCLQHLLTKVDYLGVSGINGVLWDTVEFCSQFMENWSFTPKVLELISRHYQTKKHLPKSLIKKIVATKNFQAGLIILRQLEFGLFDFELHIKFNSKIKNQTQKILNSVRKRIRVAPLAHFDRMQNSFAHIFAGGYAAGYYSYKWAEVLALDAFAKFAENGFLNQKIGLEFLQAILEVGGSVDPIQAFKNFRGRKPKINYLLKNYNINQ